MLENDKIKQWGNWQKKSNRGGLRPGAGRPPGSRNKRNKEEDQRLFDACANALVKALDGALPTQVIVALWALGRPLREAREARLACIEDALDGLNASERAALSRTLDALEPRVAAMLK